MRGAEATNTDNWTDQADPGAKKGGTGGRGRRSPHGVTHASPPRGARRPSQPRCQPPSRRGSTMDARCLETAARSPVSQLELSQLWAGRDPPPPTPLALGLALPRSAPAPLLVVGPPPASAEFAGASAPAGGAGTRDACSSRHSPLARCFRVRGQTVWRRLGHGAAAAARVPHPGVGVGDGGRGPAGLGGGGGARTVARAAQQRRGRRAAAGRRGGGQ